MITPKRAPVIILILFGLLLHALPGLCAPETRGFEGVAFGTRRADVIEQLCVNLKIDKIQGFSGIEYRGPNGLRLVEEEEDVVLQGYHLDKVRTDAVLVFNVNQKFFRVEYEAQKRPSGYFQTTIKDDVENLSRHFQKAYGAPTFKMEPRLSEMRPGSRNYFWRWTRGRDTVYTAIVGYENDFGAVAVLSDDSLLREMPEARPEPSLPPAVVEEPAEKPNESFTTNVDTTSVVVDTITVTQAVVESSATAPVPVPVPEPETTPVTPPPSLEFVPAQDAATVVQP